MEELKAMFRVCVHIKKDGVRCNSPAMKGMNFCYQHIGGNIRELTRARSTYIGPKLDFVYPGCRQAIQHNFFVIAQAMNDGHIDLQTACAYNRIYSACERNLRRFETLYQKDAEAELAPLPDENPESETSPTDVIPLSADVIPLPADVILSEVDADRRQRVEGPASSQPSDNSGAPSFRGLCERVGEQRPSPTDVIHPPTDVIPPPTDVIPLPTDVILSDVEADQRQRVEGPASSQPNDNLGAPRLEETWEQVPNQPDNAPVLKQAPTFDILTIDFKKYDLRFKKLERLYSSDDDYIDRLRAAIRQIHEEEEQAWRAAGCPELCPVP